METGLGISTRKQAAHRVRGALEDEGGMARKRSNAEVAKSISSVDAGGSFFASILAGLLIGYFLDKWLGTGPWLIVIFTLTGAYSGFLRVWHYAKTEGEKEDQERMNRGR